MFNGIISDLFPNVKLPTSDSAKLLESLKKSCITLNLQPVDSFINKCIQFYETTIVRHGLMLVGPTGGGKTSAYRVLADAITALKGTPMPNGQMFQRVDVNVLNPKSITMGQLYGEFDIQTHEWSDGLVPRLVRSGQEEAPDEFKWYH